VLACSCWPSCGLLLLAVLLPSFLCCVGCCSTWEHIQLFAAGKKGLNRHCMALQVLAPLSTLLGLPALRVVDMRGLHEEPALGYWSEAKCTSMRYVSAFTKALRRRPYATKVLCRVD